MRGATEEAEALNTVMRAIETFVPDPDFAIRKPSALIYEEVVRYGEVIRRGERLLADVRENGT